ncbi:MAG TPA: hypothetical protein VHY18_14260 [Solirubrobacteraceae bacterium]|nr:hypothetical protein [Solirubrobacteraceae bacterium]
MNGLDARQIGSQQPDSRLRRRRDQLAEEVAELHWNLGGLAYEMAIRDHFRLDVLIRRAAMLQERDAELAEVERMLHMQESGSAGNCASCGAVRSRGAVFCWQCGAQVMERTVANDNGHRSSTPHPIDALAGVVELGGDSKAEHSHETQPRFGETQPSFENREAQQAENLGRPVQTSS